MASKCKMCLQEDNIKKIQVPVRKRGKITKYKTLRLCPTCLRKHYPEYIDVYSPLLIRGSKVSSMERTSDG